MLNPNKFQAIVLDKRKNDNSNQTIVFNNYVIGAVSSIRLVGIQLDDKLNFNLHVSNICKSPANQIILLTLRCLLRSLTTAHGTRPPIIHKLDLDHRIFLWKLSALHRAMIFLHVIINIL